MEYKHWCGNCQIRVYVERHYDKRLSWEDCPYTCEYAAAMRASWQKPSVDDILSRPPKHYTREEAKECLMSIGVMDENENLIPPYDKIFAKRGEE